MNEHPVVRGYRFRPLSAKRLPALMSDRDGLRPNANLSADAVENRQR
jgi:hypothetical protein